MSRKNDKRNQPPSHGGFTLLEVMVVLFILVTMAGLAVVAVRGQQAKAQRQAASIYVNTLDSAVGRYTLDVGRPPSTDQGLAALITCPQDISNQSAWAGPYIDDRATSKDPWGMEYQYTSPGKSGREFDIWSFGPDMTDGTEDDIGSWKTNAD